MKRKYLFAAVGILCAMAIAITGNIDTVGVQFGIASALAFAAYPFLPRVEMSHTVFGCDDVAGQIAQLTKDLAENTKSLRDQQTQLKSAHDEVMKSIEDAKKLDKDKQDNIDKAISKANETATAVNDLAQKIDDLTKQAQNTNHGPLTLRKEILKNLGTENKERYDSLLKGDQRTLRLVLKEITSADVSTGMKREPYIDSLVSMERQPLRIRDLLTVVPVQSDSVKYGKQTLRQNLARIVEEGTAKPYSNYKWEDATASIETIAHLAKLTLQALADAPRLAAEVESEMVYGYRLAEEASILNGDGTPGNLSGLILNATPYAPPAGMDTTNILTPIDRLRVAMLQIHLAYAIPDGHVLNPINVAEIDLMRRDPDQGGGYLFSRPDGDTGVVRMWRLPVVESPSMEVNDFLTGAFKYSVHLYDRAGVVVAISTENDTDFETNKATMRVEGRLGLGVRRPYGLVTGNLKAAGS